MPRRLAAVPTQASDEPRKYRTVDASAEYLRITTKTLRKLIADGLLPCSRIAGTKLLRIDQADLDKLLVPVPAAESVSA